MFASLLVALTFQDEAKRSGDPRALALDPSLCSKFAICLWYVTLGILNDLPVSFPSLLKWV